MSIDLRDSRVLVTGGQGFLGKFVTEELLSRDVQQVSAPPHSSCNLTDFSDAGWYFKNFGPFDYVIHLAGYNGGIEFNRKYPADIFTQNTMMALNLMQCCVGHEKYAKPVKKVVSVVASCAYPHMEWHGDCESEVMFENDFVDGPPHGSVACHGYAKRNLQLASTFYNDQYGLEAVCVCPTTLYGPGDSLDPERTKVMGGMIQRFLKAKREKAPSVTCWGTGSPLREFLYVEDAAKLIVDSLVSYDNSSLPLNLGTGQEVSIKELAMLVASAVGYEGGILWDTTKPNGQHRKRLDLTRMWAYLRHREFTPLEYGIRRTIESIKGT